MELVSMNEAPRIAIIGEAMLELSQDPAGNAKLAYGGDTLNTATYMARLGASVDYITALGVDPYLAVSYTHLTLPTICSV